MITSKTVILKNVRGSYLNLFEGKVTPPSTTRKWGGTLLMDKVANAADIAALQKAIAEINAEATAAKLKPTKFPLHDGALKEDKDGYGANVAYLVCNNRRAPMVIRARKVGGVFVPITDPLEAYSGAYYNAKVNLYFYDATKLQGSRGITASLEVLQFSKDGETFSHKITTDGLEEVAADVQEDDEIN